MPRENPTDAARSWLQLDALFDDSTVQSVELARFGGGLFSCRIRRDRVVHVTGGEGPTPADALREAFDLKADGE